MPTVAVVGIGASAGGLEACRLLLADLPADTGLAIVFIQHLDPTHESSLAGILGRVTTMPVTEAGNGVPVEPNARICHTAQHRAYHRKWDAETEPTLSNARTSHAH